ncbi:MAG TPA: GNAT family N-acetyltransferase [Nocardioides sp.]|nr:GNAT family N-acetyltransferase [Nocardioides sp.]
MDNLGARVLTGDDWRTWRDLRLRSLADAPHAFGSTWERERAFTDEEWRARVAGWTDPDETVAGPAVVAEADGVPVGLGGGFRDEPGMLHVVAMWTDPVWRGRGVGRLVLDTLRSWAEERGLRLHLDVEAGNAGARRLYERYGFVATGDSRPLRPGSTYSCDRMVLRG